MRSTKWLTLLLLALLAIGLGAVTFPEEVSATPIGPHLYDGDDDDDAVVAPGQHSAHHPRQDIGLVATPELPAPESEWARLDHRFSAGSVWGYLGAGLTRAPPSAHSA